MTPPHTDLETPYIALEEDLGCLNDYFLAALDQKEPKLILLRLWKQEIEVVRSRPHTSGSKRETVFSPTHCPVCGAQVFRHFWCIDTSCGWDSSKEERGKYERS